MNPMLQVAIAVYLLPIGLCACVAGSPKMSTAALSIKGVETMIQNEPIAVVGIELRTTNEKNQVADGDRAGSIVPHAEIDAEIQISQRSMLT